MGVVFVSDVGLNASCAVVYYDPDSTSEIIEMRQVCVHQMGQGGDQRYGGTGLGI